MKHHSSKKMSLNQVFALKPYVLVNKEPRMYPRLSELESQEKGPKNSILKSSSADCDMLVY